MGKVIIWISLLLIMLSVTGCIDSKKSNDTNESIEDNVTISEGITDTTDDTTKDITEDTNDTIISEGIKDDINESATDNVTISEGIKDGINDVTENITADTNESIENNVTISEGIKDGTNDTVKDTGFLSETFKVNDQKKMLDKNIKLLELETEEGTALISIDGISYRFTYNIEQNIGGRIIKIIDLNGIDQTVKIMVK